MFVHALRCFPLYTHDSFCMQDHHHFPFFYRTHIGRHLLRFLLVHLLGRLLDDFLGHRVDRFSALRFYKAIISFTIYLKGYRGFYYFALSVIFKLTIIFNTHIPPPCRNIYSISHLPRNNCFARRASYTNRAFFNISSILAASTFLLVGFLGHWYFLDNF
jgi:hypothetical protein